MPREANTGPAAGEFLRDQLSELSRRLRKAAQSLPEAEAVHNLRVCARRLRALLSNFRTFLPPAASDVRAGLKNLAAGFSGVRDLDVMLENLEHWRGKLEREHRKPLKEVLTQLATGREALMQAAFAALEHWRNGLHEAGLKALTERGEGWPPEADLPMRMVALGQLSAAHSKFQKALEKARKDRTLPQYHELRIRGKKLRYVLQALTDVYGKPARQMLKDLGALQDGFGAYLDAEVAAQALEKKAAGLSPAARKAAAHMAGICREKAARRLDAMPKILNKLDEKRWKRFMGSFGKTKG